MSASSYSPRGIGAGEFLKWLEVFNISHGGGAASGTVSDGTINELGVYAAAGNTISGLTTANSGLLVTSATGVPSIGNAVLADVTLNGVNFGAGLAGLATNVYIGDAGNSLQTGGANVCIGTDSVGTSLTDGSANILIGKAAGALMTSGFWNMCVGQNSGDKLTTESGNTVIGARAGNNLTSSNVSAFGLWAGKSLTTGGGNTCLGTKAGTSGGTGADVTTGSNNTFIGYLSSSNSSAASGTISIGLNSISEASTGTSSATNGPGIAIGSSGGPVGFRGDGTIYPTAGASAGYWRIKVNGTQYKVQLFADT